MKGLRITTLLFYVSKGTTLLAFFLLFLYPAIAELYKKIQNKCYRSIKQQMGGDMCLKIDKKLLYMHWDAIDHSAWLVYRLLTHQLFVDSF